MSDQRSDIDIIFDALEAPFDTDEIEHRAGSGGKDLLYVKDTAVKRRLDQVLGRANWECDVTPYADGVRCAITITLPGGAQLTRSSLGGFPQMPSKEDSFKGGDTDAFKRAAARFGVAEYLKSGSGHPARQRERIPQYPRDRRNDAPDVRRDERAQRPPWGAGDPARQSTPQPRTNGSSNDSKPLYARLRDAEGKRGGKGLVTHMQAWGERQGFPPRINDWRGDQVERAEAEARVYMEGELAHA